MKLHFRKSGKGKPLVLLHGLLGSSDNLINVGKHFEDRYEVFIPDLRNQGRSPHHNIMTYSAMADDLSDFFEDNNITSAILLGHSMGGKTAMQFALNNSDKVEKLIVVDIGIKKYPLSCIQYVNIIKDLNFENITQRKEIEEFLSSQIPDEGIVKLILKNIEWHKNKKFGWRINIEALNSSILDAIISKGIYNKPALFIKGALSKYIIEEDLIDIKKKFPLMTTEIIPDAEHWVHVDNMDFFIEVIKKFL